MRVSPRVLVTCSIVFICWCFSEAGWLISKAHRPYIPTRGQYSFDPSKRDLPPVTRTDYDQIEDNHGLHVRYRDYRHHRDGSRLESLHDAIIVIATVVIATSWITVFTLILHGRFQRNMDQRFQAIVVAQLDPHQTFIDTRRQG